MAGNMLSSIYFLFDVHTCICSCIMYMMAPIKAKRGCSDPLELELKTVVVHCVDAGN